MYLKDDIPLVALVAPPAGAGDEAALAPRDNGVAGDEAALAPRDNGVAKRNHIKQCKPT